MIKAKNKEAAKLVSELENIVDKMKIFSNKKDYSKISDLDLKFHLLIIDSADNELFNSLYETLKAFLKEEVVTTNLNYSNPEEIWNEHRNLLDALKTGDKLTILTEYENHLRNILLHIIKK